MKRNNKEKADSTQVLPLEDNNTVVEKVSPEIEYQDASRKKRNRVFCGIVCLILVEAGVAGFLLYTTIKENFHMRIVREIQNLNDGKVEVATGTYTGELDFGLFDGKGEFIFDTGAVYKGTWENDQIQGIGTLKVPVKGTYEGDFDDGVKEGTGVFTWNDGDVYDGEWHEDQMSGEGTYTTADSVLYEGTFEDNQIKEGTCKFANASGEYLITLKEYQIDSAEIIYTDGTSYVGECDLDGIEGSGTMTFANEDTYSGEFVNDKRSGSGVYSWKSGATYDGDWLNDDMSGKGTYTYSKDNYATGTFDDNVFIEGKYHVLNDFGEYTFNIVEGEPKSVEMHLKNGTTYYGYMDDGKLNGQASIEYSNGDTYSGKVVNNQKSGSGIYTWKNGGTYDGEWSEDKMNGNGTYTYPSKEPGYKLTGNFKKGKPDGECYYYVSAYEYYKTDWSNGICVKVYE